MPRIIFPVVCLLNDFSSTTLTGKVYMIGPYTVPQHNHVFVEAWSLYFSLLVSKAEELPGCICHSKGGHDRLRGTRALPRLSSPNSICPTEPWCILLSIVISCSKHKPVAVGFGLVTGWPAMEKETRYACLRSSLAD